MATDDRQILVVGTAPTPASHTIPGNGQIRPKAIFATFNGVSAATAFLPAIKITSDGGELIGIYPAPSVAAAGSADVSWFPGADVDEPSTAGGAGVITEQFFVSSVNSVPVTSATTLQSGRQYVVTVQGTYTVHNAALGFGTPNADAMFPTSLAGRVSTQVGLDAETQFANDSAFTPGHVNNFQIDIGDGLGLRHIEPVGGPFATPQTNYFYTYNLTGQGSTARFLIFDSVYTDNYGKLLVTIQTVGGSSGGGGAGSLLPDPTQQPDGNFLRTLSGTAVWQSVSTTPGAELDYVQRTTDLTVTANSAATAQAWIDGNAVTYDGSTRIKIEAWAAAAGDLVNPPNLIFELYDGATDLGAMGQIDTSPNSAAVPFYGARFLTPSAGAHTIHVKAWQGAGTPIIHAAPTYLPAWYRITKA